ncbi:serine/threonine protein kinase [Acerihabitans sp. TG2]|uniref:serine/threonine protein kinase n=1 Tax=Acerihabitans sp. TG2 TaxID=3096008 RepID=UPI002B22A095|nr:serine/threonine protein kinase [Acerihabitans sp. TG2]MEA9392405.1 serine/threonine protein kinase [Acerihabitans sp. TG2]
MNTTAFNFKTLMPDLIMDALQSVGIRVDSGLTALNSYENRVYQFLDEDKKRYVVKFYRPERWSVDQILEEHELSLGLADAEIPVVPPLRINGATLLEHQGFHFAVFPSVGGRQFEQDNDEQLEWVGRFIGRIHRSNGDKLFTARPTIDLEEYLYEPRRELENSSLITGKQKTAFLQSVDTLIAEVKLCWTTQWRPLRLHGDLHASNIMWRDGPMFVDLDDARNGPAVQDLWMLLTGDRIDQQYQLSLLLDAYGEFMDFNPRELALIEPLRAMRMIYYLAWISRRWGDPAFPYSFPWMVEGAFWSQQTLIFTEQVKLLHEPPLQLMPIY